jgi:hypothetical protein
MNSYPRYGQRTAAPAGAVRVVGQWGLLAGVTGLVGGVLLMVMFATADYGTYEWTGTASDVIGGIVSDLAMIPVAVALLAVCGRTPGLGAITSLTVLGMAAMGVVSLLYVLGILPFGAQLTVSAVGLVLIAGWLLGIGRTGRRRGRLPRQVAAWARALGLAGLAGTLLLGASAMAPAGSPARMTLDVAWRLLAGAAFLAFPVWLIVLSQRLPAHPTRGLASGRPR